MIDEAVIQWMKRRDERSQRKLWTWMAEMTHHRTLLSWEHQIKCIEPIICNDHTETFLSELQ